MATVVSYDSAGNEVRTYVPDYEIPKHTDGATEITNSATPDKQKDYIKGPDRFHILDD